MKDTSQVNSTGNEVTVDQVFWEDSFLAVLPFAMKAEDWTINEDEITTGDDRVALAAAWADAAAVEHAKRFPPVPKS